MKIFLSYSGEDKDIAEQVQLALTGLGHEVFFDQNSLPAAGEYNMKIRKAIRTSNLFIFLISPNSVEKSAYAQTELNIAKEKWPHPKDHVLPVIVRETDFNLIPNYLKAVTIANPSGNIAAEVTSIVINLTASIDTKEKLIKIFHNKSFLVVSVIIIIFIAISIIIPDSMQKIYQRFNKEKINDPVKNTMMELTGIVYINEKVTEGVRISIPEQFKSEITNSEGKFMVDDIDTSKLIEIHFSHDKSDLDTTLKYNRGDLRNNMDFILESKKIPLLPDPSFKTITGIVIDQHDNGIPGVNVQIGAINSITDQMGNFRIRIPDDGSSLVQVSFTMTGYQTKTEFINPNQQGRVFTFK